MNRRQFIQRTGAAVSLGAARGFGASGRVALILDPRDPVASQAPVKWAVHELEQALEAHGIAAPVHARAEQAAAEDLCVLVSGPKAPAALQVLERAGTAAPTGPEALVLARGQLGGRHVLAACGSDPRGLVYAVLEAADRVRHAADPLAALEFPKPVSERPANRVRSVARCFESDVEDLPWYHDRAMWDAYLSMLAAQRFNRFSLTFGLGYNFPRHVRDVYFYFTYPFLFSVPGYDVRVRSLADSERDRNLETLRYIAGQTAARGMEFQVGLWTHAYQWVDSPDANYTVEGLNPQNHAAYCRDALATLLKECPAIGGVTFRIHGESGVPEGNYDFWRTLFEGAVRAGRPIEIDMHAKGMDRKMIDVALATGMPVKVSPKYWAEHMGLPYHQAAIRELEMPDPRRKVDSTFELSAGSRRFLRYGYGDLLREDRRYGVLFRIWPGTQRVLLWGDPAMAAGYGRCSSFCGADGVELQEPLSFKGRMGSGLPGGRCAYRDRSLHPKHDWEKYAYTYRVWGRSIYNPDTDPDGWRRELRKDFSASAPRVETALAHASRILLLVTTAHGASGSNNTYWPEMYTNMPIVDAARNRTYRDTPAPRVFGMVSPFDPQLFASVDEFAEAALAGERLEKYSPIDVALWLEECAGAARTNTRPGAGERSAAARRISADVLIQAGLGRFFAAKTRAAVFWAIWRQSGDREALAQAIKAYRAARDAWVEVAATARPVYREDVTYGMTPHLRGHWADRLPAIDQDLADMIAQREHPAPSHAEADAGRVRRAIEAALASTRRRPAQCRHAPPPRFRAGQAVGVVLAAPRADVVSASLYYRHVNQAEKWRNGEMAWRGDHYAGTIPAEYTSSPFPLQYYFAVRERPEGAFLYPGLAGDLSNQPYFVVRQA